MTRLQTYVLVASAVLFGLSSSATFSASSSAPESVVAKGRAILTAKCARCHAIEREGDSPLAQAPAFRNLHKKYPVATIAEALAEGIVTGHPDMHSTPFLQDEIDGIVGYIESLAPAAK